MHGTGKCWTENEENAGMEKARLEIADQKCRSGNYGTGKWKMEDQNTWVKNLGLKNVGPG